MKGTRFGVRRHPGRGAVRALVGDLTIRGDPHEVVLEVRGEGRVKDMEGNERAGFSARTRIDRTDFGLTWNQALEAGGGLIKWLRDELVASGPGSSGDAGLARST